MPKGVGMEGVCSQETGEEVIFHCMPFVGEGRDLVASNFVTTPTTSLARPW